VDNYPTLASSYKAAYRTGLTVLEIDDRVYNETTSITDTLDLDLVLSSRVEGLY